MTERGRRRREPARETVNHNRGAEGILGLGLFNERHSRAFSSLHPSFFSGSSVLHTRVFSAAIEAPTLHARRAFFFSSLAAALPLSFLLSRVKERKKRHHATVQKRKTFSLFLPSSVSFQVLVKKTLERQRESPLGEKKNWRERWAERRPGHPCPWHS